MRTARKLFRLYKTVNEVQKLLDFMENPPSGTDETNMILCRTSS